MRLSKRTIETLAQMICGKHGDPYNPAYEWLNFPYRSGSRLYDFFSEDCLLSPIPDFEGARTTWTRDVLTDINNGKVSHWGISSDKLVLHVIERLLVSVTRHHELDHQEAINDVNKALAEHGLIVVFVDGKHRIARIVKADSPFGLIGYADVEKLLDDFVSYIKSERRMSFWEWDEDNRKYKWRSKPERYAQDLLHTSVSMRFGDDAYIFEEVGAGAGRVDIYIVTPIGERFIVELKMCGAPYSLSYAQGGFEQLIHYMENKNTKIGYLIVFDGRKRDFAQGFLEEPIAVNEMSVITKVVDLRPHVITGE